MHPFTSKILLFGEYGLIHNSMGLSIPFSKYQGVFTFQPNKLDTEAAKQSNAHLKLFCAHLMELQAEDTLGFEIHLKRFEDDINKGLVFDSDIPQGYGVGSSGALVAGVYMLYAPQAQIMKEKGDKLTAEDRLTIKNHLKVMESYFHGSSSGVDPLICFLKEPLLIKGANEINTLNLPELKAEGKSGIFLINTEQVGMTANLVNLFKENCKDKKYLDLVNEHLIPFTNTCVEHFIAGDVKALFKDVKHLSKFVLSHLTPMVPQEYQTLIQRGLDNGKYSIKLCGSGGGGYLLGFAENLEDALNDLKAYKIEVLTRF